MRVTTAANVQWQALSLPGKLVGDIRAYYHDVPLEEKQFCPDDGRDV